MAIFGSKNKTHEEVEPTPNDVDKLSIKGPEPGLGGQFKEFLKTVISFTGDLSSLTCPAFFLNGLSLLEYGQVIFVVFGCLQKYLTFFFYCSTYWGDHPTW